MKTILSCLVQFYRYSYYHVPCHSSSFKIFRYDITTRFLVLPCLIWYHLPITHHFPVSPLFYVLLLFYVAQSFVHFSTPRVFFNLIEVYFLLKVPWRRLETIDFSKHETNVTFSSLFCGARESRNRRSYTSVYIELRFGGLAKEWWRNGTKRVHSLRMRKNSGRLRVPIFFQSGNEISSLYRHFTLEPLLRFQATQSLSPVRIVLWSDRDM